MKRAARRPRPRHHRILRFTHKYIIYSLICTKITYHRHRLAVIHARLCDSGGGVGGTLHTLTTRYVYTIKVFINYS